MISPLINTIAQHEWLRTHIARDHLRMRILRHVRALKAQDCWVAAGVVRSLVWDRLHQRTLSPLPDDIDVIWYNPEQNDERTDQSLEASLSAMDTEVRWSVKNQARMHVRNGDKPYQSATDAMIYWPETATAVAIRLSPQDEIEIAAPFGLDDLFALVLRPTPHFQREKYPIFLDRVCSKQWQSNWPELTLSNENRATPHSCS
jgi:hypothetical protein